MDNPVDLISRMQDFCGFLVELSDVRADVLLAPMAEGKWSVQEVVAHIMTYDEVFLQSVVIPIEDGRQRMPLTRPTTNPSMKRLRNWVGN